MLKKLFSHSLVYGLAPQIPRLASLLILPFTTPYLTKLDYGIFGILTAYSAMLGTINNLGLNVILSNTFYKHRNHYRLIWRQIYGFLNLWNIVYAILMGAILYAAMPLEALENRWELILLSTVPIVFMGQTKQVGELFYQLNRKPFQIGLRSAIIGSFAVFLNYLFIAVYKLGYLGFFYSTAISTILYNASYYIPIVFQENLQPIYNFKPRLIKNSLKLSAPLIPHSMGAYLNSTSDRIIMDNMKISSADIGGYNFAYSFSNLFNAVAMAINKALTPVLLENCAKQKERINSQLIFIFMATLLAIGFVGCLWMNELFGILIKKQELRELYPIAILLVMMICYRPMYVGGVHKLFYEEKTQIVFYITLVSGLANIILNIIFIPKYGYISAVYISYFTYLIQGYILYAMKGFRAIQKTNNYPLFWLFVQLSSTAIVYSLRDANVNIKVLATAIGLVIFGGIILKANQQIKLLIAENKKDGQRGKLNS